MRRLESPGGRLPAALGMFSAAIGVAALALWAAGSPWVAGPSGEPWMLPLCALGASLGGVAAIASAARPPRLRQAGRALGALLALLGLAILAEHAVDVDLGLDLLMFSDRLREHGGAFPGRPSPQSASSMLFLGSALLVQDTPPPWSRRLADSLALLGGVPAYLALAGYVSHAPGFERHGPLTGMALPTIAAYLAVTCAILGLRPDRGVAAVLLAPDPGALALRRLLPVVLVVPLAVAYLRVLGGRAGLFDEATGIGIMTVTVAVVSTGILLVVSRHLTRMDTVRRTEAESVRVSEARLRAILDNSPDVIFIKDVEGRYLAANPAAARALGLEPEAVIGKTDAEILPAEPARRIRDNDAAVIRSGEVMTFEDDLVLPGGGSHTLFAVLAPYRADGRVAGVVGVVREISERKRAESALRASEARFRTLIEAAPDGVFLVDGGGRILMLNPAAERLFGYARADLLGKSIDLLVPETRRAAHASHVASFMTDPHVRRLGAERGLEGRRKDGTHFDADISLSPLELEGRVTVMAIVRDITENRRMQAELARHQAEMAGERAASRLKDVFLSTLSHEIKTPLSLILGYTELLDEKYRDEPLVTGIQAGARRLLRHVDDLLTYSAILAGSLPLYRTEVCLPEIVESAVAGVAGEMRVKKQEMAVYFDPDIPVIEGDSRRLGQVVLALLENAARFTPAGGHVEVRVRRAGHEIELEVRDDGAGMTSGELERIWEPFAQAGTSLSERTGGLGLGLKIARGLVELHGGKISLLSSPGKGSQAIVRLPAGVPAKASRESEGEREPGPR